MNKLDFAKNHPPEVRETIRKMHSVPIIRQAVAFYVMQAVEQMGQARGRKQIIAFLLEKLAPHRFTIPEVEYLYDMAKSTWERDKGVIVVASSANSRIIQN